MPPLLFQRVIAMTEIRFSNSMIAAWWRVLKHKWHFLHPLDSVAKVRRLVEFYVHEHNSRVPHSAFRGQTPDEMYFGTGASVPDRLAEQRADTLFHAGLPLSCCSAVYRDRATEKAGRLIPAIQAVKGDGQIQHRHGGVPPSLLSA